MEMPQESSTEFIPNGQTEEVELDEGAPIIIQVMNVVIVAQERGLDIIVENEGDEEAGRLEMDAEEAHALMHAMTGLRAMGGPTGSIW